MKDPFKFKKKDTVDGTDKNDQSKMEHFAKKIGEFFSTEPQKEKVLSHEDFNAAGDVYYATVSASYKVAQRILWLFFVFFMVISIIANFREITYENFFYLAKEFTSAADEGSNNYETLSYESDQRQNFVLYRGGIATVSPSKMSIFTATGRRTLNYTSSFSSPYATSSDKYVLVYDTSGNTFSIYNSFARVYTETLDHPVKCASLADDGSFAIVTRSPGGYWTTRIYTKSFKLKATIPSNEYIFSISMDSSREKLAILTYDTGDGTGETVLKVYDLSGMKDSKGNEIELENETVYRGEFPIKCGFLANNTTAVITDRYVRLLDGEYSEKDRSPSYSSGNITGYFLDSEGVAVSFMQDSVSKLIAYDGSGDLLYEDRVSSNVSDVSVCGSQIFMQTEQGVIKLDPKTAKQQLLTSGQGKMLVYDKNTVLVCGESKAEYLVFEK